MSRDGWAALPRGATGLSAVCDRGISWSYSLTIFVIFQGIQTSIDTCKKPLFLLFFCLPSGSAYEQNAQVFSSHGLFKQTKSVNLIAVHPNSLIGFASSYYYPRFSLIVSHLRCFMELWFGGWCFLGNWCFPYSDCVHLALQVLKYKNESIGSPFNEVSNEFELTRDDFDLYFKKHQETSNCISSIFAAGLICLAPDLVFSWFAIIQQTNSR